MFLGKQGISFFCALSASARSSPQHLVSLVFLDYVLAALHNLPAVYQAGSNEIYSGLYPQSLIFERCLMQGSSHAVDTHKSVDAECGRKEIGKVFTERRDGTSRL